MRMMAEKQKEIMAKFGLQAGALIDKSTPVFGEFNVLNAMTLQTPEGNQNITDRISEVG